MILYICMHYDLARPPALDACSFATILEGAHTDLAVVVFIKLLEQCRDLCVLPPCRSAKMEKHMTMPR